MTGNCDFSERAVAVSAAWGGLDGPPRFVSNRENAVFEVRFANGRHAALRLHRPGYQSDLTIRSELLWTSRLVAQGFPCPAPIPTETGDLCHVASNGHIASAVTWLDGTPIGAKDAPRAGAPADQVALYRDLGALVGALHNVTDQPGVADGITRPEWTLEGFLGAAPRWGRFWENPALNAPEIAQVLAAREAARAALNARPGRDMGLIHADVLQENVLSVGGDLALIDFDDNGYGYRAYDLATGLIQHTESPDFEALQEALIAGYTTKRGDGETLTIEMPLFLLLRSMASAGWIISRALPEDPIQRFYADRMLRFATAFLDGN